jgi:hypothetical protein
LYILEPPRIVLNPTRQVVKRGDNAQIMCTADGDQPITITWSKLSSRSLPPTVQTSGGFLRVIFLYTYIYLFNFIFVLNLLMCSSMVSLNKTLVDIYVKLQTILVKLNLLLKS